MSKPRKGYIITFDTNDHVHVQTLSIQIELPDGLRKFVDRIYGTDLAPLLSIGDRVKRSPVGIDYALITRRAAARRIVQLLNEQRILGRSDYKLTEIGVFDRSVRPVSHWNVMRQYRNVDAHGKALTKWGSPIEWDTGIDTRDEARRIAADQYEEHQKPGRLMSSERVKFTVVPVYADETSA